MKKSSRIIAVVFLLLLVTGPVVFAQKADEKTEQVEKKLDMLLQEIGTLQTRLDQLSSRQEELATEIKEELKTVKIWIHRKG